MQVALITGANKGIGYEVAVSLATKHNFHVLLGARDQNNGERAAQAIKSLGGSVEYVPLDVTNDASIKAVRELIEQKHNGKLDVVINNAALISTASDLRTKIQETYNVNVFGPAVVIETLSDLLEKSPNPRIVNVSSSLGSLTSMSDENYAFRHAQVVDYNSSKSALNALTVIYAYQLQKRGIKINSVCPGYTSTDLNGHNGVKDPKDSADSVIRLVLIEKDGPSGKNFADDGSPLPW